MEQIPINPSGQVLDPMDRRSEVLFGLIMALTFTCTLGVVTTDNTGTGMFSFTGSRRDPG
jgi:hypothetical protein